MVRRNTIQKKLVFNAVNQLKNHATAEEVFRLIQKDNLSVSRATVYRNLNLLATEGAIRKIEMPGVADRYDHNLTDHAHSRCVRCGRLFDVALDTSPELTAHVRDAHGAVLLGCDILFKGICRECHESGETA